MPDSLLSNHTAYVASLRGCPSCPDRLSAIAGMRTYHLPQAFLYFRSLLDAHSWRPRLVRVPRHDGYDSGLMVDSIQRLEAGREGLFGRWAPQSLHYAGP